MSHSPSSSWSLLSRITSPFTNKTRNISDFHIQLDEPHRQFFPGDAIKGSVFLTIHKPVRVTHLVLCLHGFVKVFRNCNSPGDGISRDGGFAGTGRGKRGTEYWGNGLAGLFEDEVVLCGEGRLSIGVYSFKFDVQLPPRGLPSSIDVSMVSSVDRSSADYREIVRARDNFVYDHFDSYTSNDNQSDLKL